MIVRFFSVKIAKSVFFSINLHVLLAWLNKVVRGRICIFASLLIIFYFFMYCRNKQEMEDGYYI